MRKLSAGVVFPVSRPPVPDGIVVVGNDGCIHDVLDPTHLMYDLNDVERHQGIICPGFVNAHCHLELSHLHGKINEGEGLHPFIMSLMSQREEADEAILDAMAAADALMYNFGVSACSDIVNSVLSIPIKQKSKIRYHNFVEVYGSAPEKASKNMDRGIHVVQQFQDVFGSKGVSLTPHSLYGVSAALLGMIAAETARAGSPLSLHFMESPEEAQYFINKSGTISERLKFFGVDDAAFKPEGKGSLQTLGHILPENVPMLFVHNTFAGSDDMRFASTLSEHIWWCLCPRSNLFISDALPNAALFNNLSSRVCFGTDSLASNYSLSFIEELKLWQRERGASTAWLIEAATLSGAGFLGMSDLGSLDTNKKPGITLITHVNPDNMMFTNETQSVRLI